jgi:hypothetical protein
MTISSSHQAATLLSLPEGRNRGPQCALEKLEHRAK